MAKFTITERVRWGDVDAAQIIFYGSYIRFFEFAESEMFRDLGFTYGAMFEQLDVWLPRRHIECDFLQAALLDDLLEVSVWAAHIGNSSLRLAFEVRRAGESRIIATAAFVLVTVQRHTFAKVPVPPQLSAALERYRG
jgi:acyl-CoA thioester hydrolase